MSRCSKYAFLLVVLLLGPARAFPQTKTDLQKKRDQINKEIHVTNQLLEETQTRSTQMQGELALINRKIQLRQDLISNINAELRLIDKRISENEASLTALEDDLIQLKENYAQIIRYAQRNRNAYSRLAYVFAARDFYQALRRLRFMQESSKYRQRLAVIIEDTQSNISGKIERLLAEKEDKEALLGQERKVAEALRSDRNTQQSTVSDLQKQEKKLRDQLKQKQGEQQKLNQAIQRIIDEEIRLAKKESKTGVFELTPEAKALSTNFESNKGKLPWPVERGVITGRFGEHPHAVLKGIKVNNNGIDITTAKDAEVRAIFQGTITSVFDIPGAGMNVIVSHGAYRTVYANLAEVKVKKGQEVSVKQVIGKVLTDDSTGKTEAHLEIWRISGSGTTKQNPEIWLYKP